MGGEQVRVIEGDALEVMATMPDGSVDAIVTDPPYGIDYQSSHRPKELRFAKIKNDTTPFIAWLPDAYRISATPSALVCFCAWKTQEEFKAAIIKAGYEVKSQVIWDRDSHGMGDLEGEFAPQHDVIWFATKGDYKFPGKRPKSVLRHVRIAGSALRHPNEKPLRLMIDLVESVCPRGGFVYDPFAGSGATLEACLKSGRRAVGTELDPRYIPVIRRRLASAATPLFDGPADEATTASLNTTTSHSPLDAELAAFRAAQRAARPGGDLPGQMSLLDVNGEEQGR